MSLRNGFLFSKPETGGCDEAELWAAPDVQRFPALSGTE